MQIHKYRLSTSPPSSNSPITTSFLFTCPVYALAHVHATVSKTCNPYASRSSSPLTLPWKPDMLRGNALWHVNPLTSHSASSLFADMWMRLLGLWVKGSGRLKHIDGTKFILSSYAKPKPYGWVEDIWNDGREKHMEWWNKGKKTVAGSHILNTLLYMPINVQWPTMFAMWP